MILNAILLNQKKRKRNFPSEICWDSRSAAAGQQMIVFILMNMFHNPLFSILLLPSIFSSKKIVTDPLATPCILLVPNVALLSPRWIRRLGFKGVLARDEVGTSLNDKLTRSMPLDLKMIPTNQEYF